MTRIAGPGYTEAADGQGVNAEFDDPLSVCEGHDGAYYVCDRNNNRIRRLDASGNTTVFTGSTPGYANGDASEALFHAPLELFMMPKDIATTFAIPQTN
ncbi:MAG: hypothetical protein GY751_03165 [Bacteroidetes bacterium]|nr:hypothetical protein [Bacteroidota bacterium]